MPFDYFDSLSAKNKRIYRASEAVLELALPEPSLEALRQKTRRLHGALASEQQRATEGRARDLVRGICEALAVPVPHVRVHEVRPTGAHGELHGLYTRWPDGRARIEVWMRTAVNERTVAFRTFLRTLAHELVHHLDYARLALEDSFHTEGFFKRESSLVKQLDFAPQESARRRREQERDEAPADETRDEKLTRLRTRLGARTVPAEVSAAATVPATVPAAVPATVPATVPPTGTVSAPVPTTATVSASAPVSVPARRTSQLALSFDD